MWQSLAYVPPSLPIFIYRIDNAMIPSPENRRASAPVRRRDGMLVRQDTDGYQSVRIWPEPQYRPKAALFLRRDRGVAVFGIYATELASFDLSH